jgi:hypothetical protein
MPLPTHVAQEIARLMRDPDALRRQSMPSFGRRGRYDPNQPRVAAGSSDGGQWTDSDRIGNGERPQLAQFPLPNTNPTRQMVRPGPPVMTLLTLFAALSAQNSPEQRAIFEFNARAFRRDPNGELDRANVEVLNREQVENECRKLEKVQEKTDKAVDNINDQIRRTGMYMSPSQFGTAVHKNLKDQIVDLRNPNLRAEISYWKMKEDNVYGRPGSIRVDVLERADENVVCVYDIKTGQSRRSGLTPARMLEIGKNVLTAYPYARHVIVTEVRPTR